MARDAGPPPEGAEQDEGQEQTKKGGGFPISLYILLGVAVVAAAAGFVVVQKVLIPRMTIEEDAEGADKVLDTPGVIYDMEQMTVNISGEMGAEFLLIKMSFECIDKDASDRVEGNKARIRGALNALLSGKRVEDTQGVVAQERLQREIRDKVNAVLGNKDVKNVYFYNLMVAPM